MAPEEIPTADDLDPNMVMDALQLFIHRVKNDGLHDSRGNFDTILIALHNERSTKYQIDAKYLDEKSTRISQLFSRSKSQYEDAGYEVALRLPRKSRTLTPAQLEDKKKQAQWAAFAEANEKALKEKKARAAEKNRQ